MRSASDRALRDALHHFRLLVEHAAGGLDSQVVIDAVCMRLSAGVESLARMDETDRDGLFGDAWPVMWGMRNRIAHGYLLVDTGIVRKTVVEEIPIIVGAIEDALRV